MGVGSGEQEGRAPTLDFQTWYKYSKKRLKSAIFRPFFAGFRSFFPLASPGRIMLFFGIFLLIFGVFSQTQVPEIIIKANLSGSRTRAKFYQLISSSSSAILLQLKLVKLKLEFLKFDFQCKNEKYEHNWQNFAQVSL